MLQTRWSWGNDSLSELQQSVAPRKSTSSSWLMTILLVIICWFLVLFIGSLIVLSPPLMGRFVLYLFHVPLSYFHDPFCVFLGIMALRVLHKQIQTISTFIRVIYKYYKQFNDSQILTDGNFSFLFLFVLFSTSSLIFVGRIVSSLYLDSSFTSCNWNILLCSHNDISLQSFQYL